MPYKKSIIICLLFLFSGYGFSQETKVVHDLGLWTEIKIEKKIIKNLWASTSQHLRLNRNISGFDDFISEIGLLYEINKHFSIGTNGRYTRNKKYDGLIENDYRYDFDFRYKTELNEKLKFYYRFRYQKEFYGSGVFYKGVNYYESAIRNRIKFRWKYSNTHRFYSTAEIFRLTKKSRDPFFDKYRIFFGDDISTHLGEFEVAFGAEHQLNSNNPYTYFILKIEYTLQL